MKHSTPFASTCAAFLAVLLVSAAPAQEVGGARVDPAGKQDERARVSGPEVVSLSQLELDRYEVVNVDPAELFQVASSMIGRPMFVKENGPGSAPITNLRLLGRSIVLYDLKPQVQRARELLARLDQERERKEMPQPVEYRPRFISLETAAAAANVTAELSLIEERGLIVLHDDAESMERALTLLARIDVPQQQVLVTCLLLEVGGTAQGPALPGDLAENLQRLLPQSTFAQVGMAMLQTSVGGQERLSVQIESTGKRYRFSLVPVAFDQGSGSLSVTSCSLVEESGEPPRELFKTNTVLRGGEYTVLAATGATTRLLVVRVSTQA